MMKNYLNFYVLANPNLIYFEFPKSLIVLNAKFFDFDLIWLNTMDSQNF